MAKVTVSVPPLHPAGIGTEDVHTTGTEFAAVSIEQVGSALEVYNAEGEQIAVYAPGGWVSAVLG